MPSPVYGAEVNVVVGINLHEQSATDITMQSSDCKVRIINHVFYTMRILKVCVCIIAYSGTH